MENKKYKLYGTLNMFDVVPCELYCVFIDEDGEYYMGFSHDIYESECRYDVFKPLHEGILSMVKPLSQTTNVLEDIEEYYQVGDFVINGFESSTNDVYIGRLDKYLDFLKDYLDSIKSEDYSEKMESIKKSLESDIDYYGGALASVKVRKQG